MKFLFSVLFILFIFNSANSQNDTIWYSDFWEKVSKSEAAFYRLPSLPKADGFWVTDYFLNGNKQMEGFSKSNTEDIFHGLATWYYKEGGLFQKCMYVDGIIEGKVESYLRNGTKTEAEYRNNTIYNGKIIFDYDFYYSLTEAKEGMIIYQKIYAINNSGIGYELYYNNNVIEKQTSYDGKGQLIGDCSFKIDNLPLDGILADYFYDSLAIRSISNYADGELRKLETYHKNGAVKENQIIGDKDKITTYFDSTGNTLGTLTELIGDYNYFYQYGGKQVLFNYNYNHESKIASIAEYQNGKKIASTLYNAKGKKYKTEKYTDNEYVESAENFDDLGNKVSSLTYLDGYPQDGVEVMENLTSTYKNGKLIEEKEFYKNGQLFKSTLNGKTLFFDKKGTPIGVLTYDDKYEQEAYLYPFNGESFTVVEDQLYTKETYENGSIKESTTYNLGFKEENKLSKTTIYNRGGYVDEEIDYFANGNKKSQIKFDDYYPKAGKFYSVKGEFLSEFTYSPMSGTEYKYFEGEDDLEYIKTYENDVLKYEKLYVKTYGLVTYQPTIELAKEIDYNGQGKFYENKKLIYTTEYKNGNPYNGKVIVQDYYAGKIIQNYEMGFQEGEQLHYEATTQKLLKKELFEKGVQQGTTEIYLNEKVSQKIPYLNGEIEGEVIYFDLNGDKASSLFYKANQPQNGTATEYYDYTNEVGIKIYANAEIIETQLLMHGVLREKQILDGSNGYLTTNYYDNGKQKFSYNLKDGLLHGKISYYSDQGKKLYQAIVENGLLKDGELWLNTSSYYYYDIKADFYKLKINKSNTNLVGITLPSKVEFELDEKNSSKEGKSMILNFLSINSLYPNSLYNNEDFGMENSIGTPDYPVPHVLEFNPPTVIEEEKK
jgi:uncharacterized protein